MESDRFQKSVEMASERLGQVFRSKAELYAFLNFSGMSVVHVITRCVSPTPAYG